MATGDSKIKLETIYLDFGNAADIKHLESYLEQLIATGQEPNSPLKAASSAKSSSYYKSIALLSQKLGT